MARNQGKIIDPRAIPGGLNFGNPDAKLSQGQSGAVLAQMAMALQEVVQKHNTLAQKMQIMAAQQQTLVEALKLKTDLTDAELSGLFEKVATDLGFTITRAPETSAEIPDGATSPEVDPSEPDGGADSPLPDSEQGNSSPAGSSGEPRPDDGGAAPLS